MGKRNGAGTISKLEVFSEVYNRKNFVNPLILRSRAGKLKVFSGAAENNSLTHVSCLTG
jgi:hypothetical protein